MYGAEKGKTFSILERVCECLFYLFGKVNHSFRVKREEINFQEAISIFY